MVDEASHYAWSSHQGYLSKAKKWDWLHKQAICGYCNIDEGQLYYTKRAVFNEARAMGLYLSRHLRGESLNRLAAQFKIRNYSAVSSIIERFKIRFRSDPALAKRVDQVRQNIMSQGQT